MTGHTELMREFIKFIINLVNLLLDGRIILKCIINECKKVVRIRVAQQGRVAVCHGYANNISCSSKFREFYNELRNY
jgi:hypothetical protein